MPTTKSVHVNPTGEKWEVESDSATLAQAKTREEAIEATRDAARQIGAARILLHTADGLVEHEIKMAPEVSAR